MSEALEKAAVRAAATFYSELLTLALAAINSGATPLSLIHNMDSVRDSLIERIVHNATHNGTDKVAHDGE